MENIKFESVKKIGDLSLKIRDLKDLSKFQSASPPSIFIGSKLKYPEVNVGILSPINLEEEPSLYEDCPRWSKENYEIKDILKLRNNLVNSRFKSNVKDVRVENKLINVAKEIAISSKSVDVEIELSNKLSLGKDKDKVLTPYRFDAHLKNVKLTSNVKVEKKVERVMNDEIKASEGINYLYQSGINEYSLSKILSVGVLGLKKNKKMVPTRWSITATDDIISKELLDKVRNYKWIENYSLFIGEFLGNQYLIMLFPGIWSYELFEIYFPGSSWNPGEELKASTDSEGFFGRTSYASNCAGGYYATRLPILEYLNSIQRQAGVLAIRLETPTYWAALGVWVVRESVKKALSNRELKFSDKKEFLESLNKISKIKYGFDVNIVLLKSNLLKTYGVQKNLRDWF